MRKGSTFEKDLTNKRFGLLKVIEFSHINKKRSHWKCICDCGKKITVSRKTLAEPRNHSCGCNPRMVVSAGIVRTWEECIAYKLNSILNSSQWVGNCLIWQGSHDKDGQARMSFLNHAYLVKDFIWFLEHKITIGRCRIVPICGNRSCINIKHLGVEAYVKRNTSIDRLFEISKNRGEQKNI